MRSMMGLGVMLAMLCALSGCASGEWVEEHVDTVGGSVSVDPVTGEITVSGNVGIKEMEYATARSNAIMARGSAPVGRGHVVVQRYVTPYAPVTPAAPIADYVPSNSGYREEMSTPGFCAACQRNAPALKRIVLKKAEPSYIERVEYVPLKLEVKNFRAIEREYRDPCGNPQRGYEYKRKSIYRTFIGWFSCAPPSASPLQESPVFSAAPATSTPASPPATSAPTDQLPEPATVSNAEDEAILNQAIANAANEPPETRGVGGDRAAVYGNNYPGTSAQLYQCVRDAKYNVLNLVKIDGFKPENIRLYLNEKCTRANYMSGMTWSLQDYIPGDRRVLLMNSSHGSEGIGPDGKVVDLLVTWDMVSTGRWNSETQLSYDWIYDTLRRYPVPYMGLNDSCHAAGQMRAAKLLEDTSRRFRSLEPPPDVKAAINNATEHSTARARVAQLMQGTIFAACAASELSEEGPDGGLGTNAYWQARRNLGTNLKSGDIVREQNRFLRSKQASQHAQLVGVNGTLWKAAAPNN